MREAKRQESEEIADVDASVNSGGCDCGDLPDPLWMTLIESNADLYPACFADIDPDDMN